MADNGRDLRFDFDGRLPVVLGGGRALPEPDQLERAEELIRSHGLVLFHGFDLSVEGLRTLTRKLGCAYGQEKWAPHALASNAPEIALHTEQAHVPSVPASVWFYMAQPAEQGGESVVCDGAAVLSTLSAGAQAFLEGTDVLYWWRYSSPVPPRRSLKFPTDPPGLGRDFRPVEAKPCGDCWEAANLCRPLITSRDGRAVFGNHILNTISRGQDREPPELDRFHQARLPSKEPLPRDLIAELKAVTARLAIRCRLAARDALWVDNTRFLHGRAAYRGTRHVLVRKAFHADQWKPTFRPGEYADVLVPPSPVRARRGRAAARGGA